MRSGWLKKGSEAMKPGSLAKRWAVLDADLQLLRSFSRAHNAARTKENTPESSSKSCRLPKRGTKILANSARFSSSRVRGYQRRTAAT